MIPKRVLEQMEMTMTGSKGSHKLSLDSVVKAAEGHASCELVDEAVILDFKSGVYYGLDSVGARIWSRIQQSTTVKSIRDAVLAEYDVEVERCEHDLFLLLEQLRERQLVEIDDESVP